MSNLPPARVAEISHHAVEAKLLRFDSVEVRFRWRSLDRSRASLLAGRRPSCSHGKEFGMQPLKASQGVWVEEISPGESAVNVIQLVAS